MYLLKKLKSLKGSKFDILKIYSKDNNYYNGFGEVYLSKLKKDIFKGYHCNLNSISNLFVLSGSVKFYIRLKNKKIKEIILNEKSKKLLIIKKKTSYGFKGIKDSCIINISTVEKSKIKKLNK